MIAVRKMYPELNTIYISLHGFADLNETIEEVDIFEASLPALPIHDMSLIIDCDNMAPFKLDILPVLEHCYDLYNGFKHAILINPKKSIVKAQIQRVASSCFKGHFVDTEEEAWAIVKS